MAPAKKKDSTPAKESGPVIPVRFNAEQKAAIEECAAASGLAVSSWIRTVCLERAYQMKVWRPFATKNAPDGEEGA